MKQTVPLFELQATDAGLCKFISFISLSAVFLHYNPASLHTAGKSIVLINSPSYCPASIYNPLYAVPVVLKSNHNNTMCNSAQDSS